MASTFTDVIPASHLDILETPGFAHVATIGPDGEPQSHPIWYRHTDDRIELSTTKGRQKYRNLQRDPRIALTILDPEDPYRYLEVRGRVQFEDDPDDTLIDELAQRYLDRDEYPYKQPGDERVRIIIEPTHANAMG